MNETYQVKNEREVVLNVGPQHPATHGVLRYVVKLDGERIVDSDPQVGFLHRGIEKLAENMTYQQFNPYTDRLDYLAAMNNNLAYVMAVEKLLGIDKEIPERAQYIRVIMAELGRIASHLVWLATHALDIGAMTVFLYCFREREYILDMYEIACGNRLTYNYIRIGGVARDLPEGFMDKLKEFVKLFPKKVKEYHTLLTKNRIWLKRTKDVGYISKEDAINYGIAGPCTRGSGVDWDLRRDVPYSVYPELSFEIPVYDEGDVYARYLVRMDEMVQSNKILEQCIEKIPSGPAMIDKPEYVWEPKERIMTHNYALMKHFVKVVKGIKAPAGEVYFGAENPKGELGFYIYSTGEGKPYRLKIRSPSFINISAMPKMVQGGLIADIISVIGSLDFVFGECDR
ncbi:NADH dehydrogenase (quinone) subunit D [Hippea maritima]|uniref:NADH-quinone oxidoreductase subunit D n=1 Tax=Hippea maritima (strain ATCC 700847 / DSM 10411 / MH2) TaxID=760142 RepID=F2LXM6_HIPMA|nr:NADH dehydrogenase (quinone) subunit D [Hippea maritima]AEA33212.1 NAD(P)H-quinone oxidoreductase subunit H [Hippea maritima DSM 10411]